MALGRFSQFVLDLERQYGHDAESLRHELFFQSEGRLPIGKFPRGIAALLRDAAALRQPMPKTGRSTTSRLALMVTTLSGTNGWGTLVRALDSVKSAGLKPAILAHPRLPEHIFPPGIEIRRPGGLSWTEIASALVSAARGWVEVAKVRRYLWRTAVERSLSGIEGVMLLHNDFDMMSTSCLSHGWPTFCLQHGIPTDEFFQCRADYQVVWGSSSEAAYRAGGLGSSRLVVDALGRYDPADSLMRAQPSEIAVISQSHARIFGAGIGEELARFVHGLARVERRTRVLLHPGEGDRHPYRDLPTEAISKPPHDLFELAGSKRALVLAHCSTALIEAAMKGHWVAGIGFDLPGNAPAHMVADPPLRVASSDEAVFLFNRLVEDPLFRSQTAAAIEGWLAGTFSSARPGLESVLRGIGRP
jgi:hypothetical protein